MGPAEPAAWRRFPDARAGPGHSRPRPAVWLAITVSTGTAGEVAALVLAGIVATAVSGFSPLYLLAGRIGRHR